MKYSDFRFLKVLWFFFFTGAQLSLSGADSQPVKVWEQETIIPTYETGDPEPNPIFFFGKQSQGAEGRVYPYPLYDSLTGKKVDKTYKIVYLENEYVRIGVLPEIGGRVFEGLDKTNNYHFFYRQHVIKPALIGLIGAWISGGVEWNIPHHHRATTALPVQYRVEENTDGSKTVWVGELEIRHRMRWAVGYTLHPGKSYLEAKLRILNRTPVVNTMLCFANVAVHVDENYQVIFPPRTQYGTHHHKREFTKWPISDSRYGSADFTRGVDISWYKNHIASNSVFAWNYEDDFVAGYDHGRQAGTMAVADHHIVPGKKFWTWGNGPRGRMWDRILTDEDGPYIEIMVGAYSDNQPDYSWLQPYETKSFEMYWYPFRDIGGARQANLEGAVNLDVANGTAKVGFHVTSAHTDATVLLKAGERVLLQEKVAISPGKPYRNEVKLPAGVSEHDLRASLSAGGRELVSYQPVKMEPKPMPKPVTDPPAPSEIKTIDELYLTGLWIEQFHNPSLEPDPYWEEALRRDPGHVQVNTALGINRLKKARYAEAEKCLRKALERLGARYATPKDGEASYYLGLALKAQGRYDEAFDSFYKATWSMAWRAPSYYALAEIATMRGDLINSLNYLDRSLQANALNLRALNLKAAVLRRLGRWDEARQTLELAHRLTDPLDARLMAERWLLSKTPEDAGRLFSTMSLHPATAAENAAEYFNAGLWQEGMEVLAQVVTSAPEAKVSPILYYYLAYFAKKLGQEEKANEFYRLARQAPPDYVFPFQWEAEPVLRQAMAADPRDSRAPYYLGNLLFDWQPEEAVRLWKRSAALDPSFPIVHRNLAIAYAHQEGEDAVKEAIARLETAVAAKGRKYALHFTELDELYQRIGVSPQKRLALLEQNYETVAKRDDSLAREIALKVFAGEYDEAIRLLSGRKFSIWEGGSLNVTDPWTDAHLLRGHQHLAAKRYDKALADYRTAVTYPENLPSESRGSAGREAEAAYWVGVAYEAMGDRANARKAWEQAASTPAPQGRRGASFDGVRQYYQALALRKLGQTEKADALFRSLVEAATRQLQTPARKSLGGSRRRLSAREQTTAAHYMAGLGYLGLNDKEKARLSMKQALESSPDHLGAKIALAQLN